MVRSILAVLVVFICMTVSAAAQVPGTIPAYEYHWIIQPPTLGKGYFGGWDPNTNCPNNQSAGTCLTNDLHNAGGTGTITLAYELLYKGIIGGTYPYGQDGTLAGINQGSALTNLKAIYAAGEVPLTTIGCTGGNGWTAKALASGTYDQYIIDAANAVKSLAGNTSIDPTGRGLIMIRPWWEFPLNIEDSPTFPNAAGNPNGNNCFSAGETYAQQAADYIALFQHEHDVFQKQGVTNATWVYCPTVGPADASEKVTQTLLDMFYPGDMYVDAICIDSYPKGGLNFKQTLGSTDVNINVRAWLTEHSNKWAFVGETASCALPIGGTDLYGNTIACATGGTPYSQCQYLTQAQDQMLTVGGDTYGLLFGMTWFDFWPASWDWNFDNLTDIQCFQNMTSTYGVQVGNNIAWGASGVGGTQVAGPSVETWVPIHGQMGAYTNGGGGSDPGPTEDQAVFHEIESEGSGFDPGSQNYVGGIISSGGDCPTPSSQTVPPGSTGCTPVAYISPLFIYCNDYGGGITDYDIQAYNQADANDELGFIHKTSSQIDTNRDDYSGQGSCPNDGQWSLGGVGQTYLQVFNYHDTSAFSPYTFFQTKWPTIRLHSWGIARVDNFSWYEPGPSGDTSPPYEYPISTNAWPADWRKTVTDALVSWGSPQEANMLGGGGSNYAGNNSGGVRNWMIDVDDVCSELPAGFTLNMQAEKPFATIGSDPNNGNQTRLLYLSYNFKTLLNTVSHIWTDSGCEAANVMPVILNFSSDQNHNTNIQLRMFNKVAEALMEPSGFSGVPGSNQISEALYTTCISCNSQTPVFPEEGVVFIPLASDPLGRWSWNGSTGDGDGCTNSDSGGMNSYAQKCGTSGQIDSGGYYAPIEVREGTCYNNGTSLGNCAAVMDLCYNSGSSSPANGYSGCPQIALNSLTYDNTYTHYYTLSGAEYGTDPKTGATLPQTGMPNGQSTGSWSLSSITGTTYIDGCGHNFDDPTPCAYILLP